MEEINTTKNDYFANVVDKINNLKNYRYSTFLILSIYLGSADKKPPPPSFYLSQLHSLIHQNLDSSEQKLWQKDINKIETYLHQSFKRSDTRSIVFFTANKNFWEVLEFEFFLPPFCISLHSSYLKPIEKAMSIYHQKYLVLLVDRKKARIFTVHLGKIEEHKDFFNGEVPQRVKAKTINLGRTDKIMRDIEGHLHRHLQLINRMTREFIKGKNVHFIIIGGHKELLPKIRSHLLYPINKMILGEFVTELNIPLSEVLTRSKKIAIKINQMLPKDKNLESKVVGYNWWSIR